MALTRLTCPVCLATLKPAQPVEEGTRVRCPKCKGAFVAEAERPAEEPVPEPTPAAVEDEEEIAEVEPGDMATDKVAHLFTSGGRRSTSPASSVIKAPGR